jgi:nicotinamide-nucleotide amidase
VARRYEGGLVHAEVICVGTELLLGQIVDTNAAWLGEQLALAGIDCTHRQTVGDNLDRIVASLELALERADAVVVCGGLGPTQDDITRDAIAVVMETPLRQDDDVADRILEMFAARGRRMPASNMRQALVPKGATAITNPLPGTAPGLICPVGDKTVYAVPGVPHEMRTIVQQAVVPDMQRRGGTPQRVIRSRTVRTWGESESGLAERLAEHMAALDEAAPAGETTTLAFLASGIEGIKVRITVKAETEAAATRVLDGQEARLRELLGDLVFGVDDVSMEHAVAVLLVEHGLTLAVAESLTGGLVASRLVNVRGASTWFRGGIVAYAGEVKRDLLGVPPGPVVSEEAALAMAVGVRRRLGTDVGIGVSGVAGPDPQDGEPPGTVYLAVSGGGEPGANTGAAGEGEPVPTASIRVALPGDRERVRQFACISLLDLLRRVLLRWSRDITEPPR